MGDARRQEESLIFREAAAEMNDLVRLFTVEFQAQVDEHVKALPLPRTRLSFLQTPEADAGVAPSDIVYPTIESLVTDMQQRRDTAENLVHLAGPSEVDD